jgi:AcrR family transcriptional regulator
MLAAAAAAFRRRGYHSTRVSDIVADAGVSQGTFYQYFASKEEAYTEVVTGLATRLEALGQMVDVDAMETVKDYREQFTAVYAAAFEAVAANRDAAMLLLRGDEHASDAARAVADAFTDRLEHLTATLVDRGVERGFLRRLDVPTVARAVVGLLLHTAARTILDEDRTDDLTALAATLVEFELLGAVAPDQRANVRRA